MEMWKLRPRRTKAGLATAEDMGPRKASQEIWRVTRSLREEDQFCERPLVRCYGGGEC